jgi:hypothetical protein
MCKLGTRAQRQCSYLWILSTTIRIMIGMRTMIEVRRQQRSSLRLRGRLGSGGSRSLESLLLSPPVLSFSRSSITSSGSLKSSDPGRFGYCGTQSNPDGCVDTVLKLDGPAWNDGNGSRGAPDCLNSPFFSIVSERGYIGVLGGGVLPVEWYSGDGESGYWESVERAA